MQLRVNLTSWNKTVVARTRRAPMALCMSLVLAQVGCANMALEPANISQRTISTRQVQEPTDEFFSKVTVAPPNIDLEVKQGCALRAFRTVETTQHYKTVNKDAWIDWTLALGGVAATGLGVWGLVDVSKTHPSDTSSRTYNPVGPAPEIGLSIGALSVGAGLIAIAVVDVVRAQRREEKATYAEQRGEVSGGCAPKIAVGTRPFLVLGKEPTADGEKDWGIEGVTDSEGRVRFDGAALVTNPADFRLLVGGKVVVADFTQYAAWQRERDRRNEARDNASQREQRAYGLSQLSAQCASGESISKCDELLKRIKDMEDLAPERVPSDAVIQAKAAWTNGMNARWTKAASTCAKPRTESDCDEIAARWTDIPPHEKEATQLMQKSLPRLDELWWAAVTRGDFTSDVYLSRFPAGRHVNDARQLRKKEQEAAAARQAAAAAREAAEAPLREAEARRQTCRNLCYNAKSSCESSCSGSSSSYRCRERCTADEYTCKAGCER